MFAIPVWMLQQIMPEAEFQAHRVQLAIDPEPDVRMVHLLKMSVPAAMALANAWGGKFRLNHDSLDPWAAAKKTALEPEDAARKRVELFALSMGFPPETK